MVPLLATGVVDTGRKFAADFTDTAVSTTLAKLVAKFDTSSKFAVGVVDTGGAP
jgi:hypothetical protein